MTRHTLPGSPPPSRPALVTPARLALNASTAYLSSSGVLLDIFGAPVRCGKIALCQVAVLWALVEGPGLASPLSLSWSPILAPIETRRKRRRAERGAMECGADGRM